MVKKTDKKPLSPKGGGITGPGPGRPKGVPNKLPATLKQSFIDAFHETGSTCGLIEWIKKQPRNRSQFYTMIIRLIPSSVELEAKVKADLGYEQAREVEKELAKGKAIDSK